MIASLGYDGLGRRTGTGYSGASSAYGYDAVSRLSSLGHDLAGTGAERSLGFNYNPASQIVTRTGSNDAYESNTAHDVNRSYSVNGLNQYTAAGPASFAYDANANLTSDGSTSFVYDAENRMVSASGGKSASLSYDPLGRLFQTSGGSAGATQFLYDGDELVAEYGQGGGTLRHYLRWFGRGRAAHPVQGGDDRASSARTSAKSIVAESGSVLSWSPSGPCSLKGEMKEMDCAAVTGVFSGGCGGVRRGQRRCQRAGDPRI